MRRVRLDPALRTAMEKERLKCGRHRASYPAWVWVAGKPVSNRCPRCAKETADADAVARARGDG